MDAAYQERVMELLQNLGEMLLKKEESEPFADYPDILLADDIVKMTRWSPAYTYKQFKRPDFPLLNGRQQPYCCFKTDFIAWLQRNVP